MSSATSWFLFMHLDFNLKLFGVKHFTWDAFCWMQLMVQWPFCLLIWLNVWIVNAQINACFLQPDHLLDDADSASKKLGKERADLGSYLFRSLSGSNGSLAFGSDWPVRIVLPTAMYVLLKSRIFYFDAFGMIWFQVADIDPLHSIGTAIKRIPPGWEDPWGPTECLTLKDAIHA